MGRLLVIRSHPGCAIQDLGRASLAHLGITQGGAADEYAFNWANRLLGNPFNSAAVEITLGGFEVEFQEPTWFAITGAKQNVLLNGALITDWASHLAKAGDRLRFLTPREGLRNYFAVSGGIVAPQRYQSCATVSKDKLGGLHGNGTPLQLGDLLSSAHTRNSKAASVSPQYIPTYTDTIQLRVIEGSQVYLFTDKQKQKLYNNEYVISASASKMGYQLSGEVITPPDEQLISEGLAIGAIQIPPAGNPILMLCERQTIGGYHKLGQVARSDIGTLAQARPGQKVRFVPASATLCASEYVSWLKFFRPTHG